MILNKKKQSGITLIVLAITIAMILIIAGTSIGMLLNNSDFIKKSKDISDNSKIKEIQGELELNKLLAIQEISFSGEENSSNLTMEKYLKYLQKKGFNLENIEDTADENKKRLTVDDYTFWLQEKNGNITIAYDENAEKIEETFRFEITSIADNSISIKVIPNNMDIQEYKCYIKEAKIGKEYELKSTLTQPEYTYINLNYNTEYVIKVEVTNFNGVKYQKAKNATTTPVKEFYFDAIALQDTITFERNNPANEEILTTDATVNLAIKNHNGEKYNIFDTNYEISIINSSKFTFLEGDKLTKTAKGNSKIDDIISLNFKIKDLSNPEKKVKIQISSTIPKEKTIELDFEVEQKGAIQTIEDLIDLSLELRGENKADYESERFKLTRNLDFEDENSYENAYRTDYGNVNLDEYTSVTLKDELTTNAGFLPIWLHEGNHDFKGTFDGGNHTISNLTIKKSLQGNIGFFGYTIGANIKNLTIKNGTVYNENQTSGMLIGKAEGGTISNVIIDGGSVTAVDSIHTNQDTYSGGIVGLMEANGIIENCTNSADVTTKFSGEVKNYSGPAGGIVGKMLDCSITNCTNRGTVIGQKFIGGIAGFSAIGGTGNIKGCHNYGTVKTYIDINVTSGPGQNVGGICGYNGVTGIVEACENHAEAYIFGTKNVGGIVGRNLGQIKNCTNYTVSSNIVGGSNVGAVYGQNDKGTVTGST